MPALLCLGEEVLVKTLRNSSLEYAKRLTFSAVKTPPAKVLLEINRRVEKGLITQSARGENGGFRRYRSVRRRRGGRRRGRYGRYGHLRCWAFREELPSRLNSGWHPASWDMELHVSTTKPA